MEDFKNYLSDIFTKEELLFFLNELNFLEKSIFKKEKKELQINLSEKTRKFFLSLPPQGEKQQRFIKKLKKILLSLPQVKITLAFSPSKEFIKEMALWLERRLKRKIILEIFVRPEIGGGAILEYEGKYLDFSLRKKIKEILRNEGRF